MPSLLIADDHPLFRAALRQAARDALGDVQLFEAGALDDVLALLDAQPQVDLVLLDLHMPGLSGIETLAAIRALPGPHLPVVAMTADASVAHRAQSISAGLDGYLTKPLTMEALRAGLARHLTKPDHPA